MDKASLRAKAETLRRLHDKPNILVLPNVWDMASARLVELAGFPALATTSSGIAFSLGYPDGEKISREAMLDVCGRIARRSAVPVSADIEAGYGPDPKDTEETVQLAIAAGIVGGNIEDGTHDREKPLWPIDIAVARIRAARRAADAAGVPFVINARTDHYLAVGKLDEVGFNETVRRGRAYREAGADCVFIPGLTDRETIRRLVEAIGGPINILTRPNSPSVPELKALGVARVSVGGMLMLATMGLVRRACEELAGPGTYGFAQGLVSHPDMNKLMGQG
jgi:2-methylisocitrate lyase-like PEP mutase family enzyme